MKRLRKLVGMLSVDPAYGSGWEARVGHGQVFRYLLTDHFIPLVRAIKVTMQRTFMVFSRDLQHVLLR